MDASSAGLPAIREAAETSRLRSAPSIASVGAALPAHRYGQQELARIAETFLDGTRWRAAAIARFFERVGVEERWLALPAERYASLRGFEERNRAWLEIATSLGAEVVSRALSDAGVEPREVSLLVTTTVTGVAVPSLDARLMNLLPFDATTKRLPLFGLGCLGGAAGLARTSEYLRAFPDEVAVLLAVELCSLTFQPEDGSAANLISTGLFGDGAAAVVLAGHRHRLASGRPPRVLATRSVFFPNTERVMGWDVVDSGFKVVLSADVPHIVEKHARSAVDDLLSPFGLARGDVRAWIIHPGGPKVIDAMERALELRDGELDRTRRSLARVGNLSSASVLFLLRERFEEDPPPPGAYAVMMAMGPAFCAELVLLRW